MKKESAYLQNEKKNLHICVNILSVRIPACLVVLSN